MDDIIEVEDCSSSANWTNEHYNILFYVCNKTKLSKEHAVQGLQFYKGDYKMLIKHVNENKTIDMVVNQTDLPRETVIEKLKQYNGDSVAVIREYLGTEANKSVNKSVNKSTNQKIFSEMRTFMDTVKTQYDMRKEINDKNQIINEYINNVPSSN
tara:strand:+ start:8267 stop:8731 length:465 start_codon:yes stop_codon:yes gene_type:complete